ncbi:MAG: hypothetical protein SGPRY_012204, partial [Prymnesium sp.]
ALLQSALSADREMREAMSQAKQLQPAALVSPNLTSPPRVISKGAAPLQEMEEDVVLQEVMAELRLQVRGRPTLSHLAKC